MLFKLIKFAFYATVIFFALYFFADVRINDVNIRDSIQQTVTPQNISDVFDEISSFFQTVKEVFQKHAEHQTRQPTSVSNKDSDDQEPLEVIYPKEREKLLKFKLKSIETDKTEPPQTK